MFAAKGGSFLETIISRMADAITDWESGGDPDALNYRNNNPGNLKPKGFTYPGQVSVDSFGHAVFSSLAYGRRALEHQLRISFLNQSSVYNSAMNLYDFFSKYAEANSANYARFVAAKLGVSPETTLGEINHA